MPLTDAQKRAIKKYRENNREKVNAIQLKLTKLWADKNKEHISEQKRAYYVATKYSLNYYYYKKEAAAFLNILL